MASAPQNPFMLPERDNNEAFFSGPLVNQAYHLAEKREFNFEVRHSPMPPDGTLRIP